MKNCDNVRVRCNHCNSIIRPDGFGTMIWCSCNTVAVDGKYDKNGDGYCHIIGNCGDYENLSV